MILTVIASLSVFLQSNQIAYPKIIRLGRTDVAQVLTLHPISGYPKKWGFSFQKMCTRFPINYFVLIKWLLTIPANAILSFDCTSFLKSLQAATLLLSINAIYGILALHFSLTKSIQRSGSSFFEFYHPK